MSLSKDHGVPSNLPEREQEANIAGTFPARPGAQDVPPTGTADSDVSNLSKQQQDANIAGTFPSRPGAQDVPPAGTSNSGSLTDSVKSSLDSVADQPSGTQSVTDQLQRGTQSVAQQLPTTQQATDTAKSGLSALVSGISNLAFGASSAAQEATVHTGSENARDVDGLTSNIPGAFDSQTDDAEDVRAVKDSLPSQPPITSQTLDTEAAKRNITGSSKPLTEQAQDAARSVAGTVMPSTQQSQMNPTISSVGANSTTNNLAGQIPLERDNMPQRVADSQRQAGGAAPLDQPAYDSAGVKGVPDVVANSQRQAGEVPEAAANPEAVREKEQMERELKREVSADQPSSGNTVSEQAADGAKYAAGAAAGGLAAAGSAVAGAAAYARQKTAETTGTDPVSVLPESAQRRIDPQTATQNSQTVPAVVSESQRAAGVGPEAAANPTAVQEKSQLERELQNEVSPAPATSTNSSITGAMSGGLASAGVAATGAATYAREKTSDLTGTDPVAVLPESAQRRIDPNVPENSRPSQAGAATRIPSSNVGSSAAPDLSYANRPQTLPKSEIAAREEERAVKGVGMTGAGGLSSGIHNGVTGAGSTQSHNIDLHSGVKNTVIGTGSGEPADAPAYGLTRAHAQDTAATVLSEPVEHISNVGNVDLTAGVRNSVTGAGGRHE